MRVEIKPSLTYPEMLAFVNAVTNACFDDDTGEYMPEVRDYATRYAIVKMYTNIVLPEDNDECYVFLYDHTNLIKNVVSAIDEEQFDAMDRSISAKIASLVDGNTKAMNSRMENLYSSISELTEQFEKIFANISEEDINQIVTALEESGLDENKFVEIYMNQKQED